MGTILNFAQAKRFVSSNIKAGNTPCLIGPPGVGKTALAHVVAKELNMPIHTLIGSNLDATDIAGFPVVTNGELSRALIPEIKAVCDAAGILLIDEWTTVPPSVRAPMMRLILERRTQSRALHPDSRIIVCMNNPEHCPGGIELDVASGNRIVRVDYCPSLDEVRNYFDNLDNIEAKDFSATLAVETGLVSFAPSRSQVETGAAYASPRAWEMALRGFVADGSQEDDVGLSMLSGAVGEESAIAFLAIKKMRHDLPSVESILSSPNDVKVPSERSKQVAALGLLARVVEINAWAAWIYASRLSSEIGVACASYISKKPESKVKTYEKEGKQARVSMLAKVTKTVLS